MLQMQENLMVVVNHLLVLLNLRTPQDIVPFAIGTITLWISVTRSMVTRMQINLMRLPILMFLRASLILSLLVKDLLLSLKLV